VSLFQKHFLLSYLSLLIFIFIFHFTSIHTKFLLKKQREEEAAAVELELIKQNQFKAKQYQPGDYDDWESIHEAAEVERTKRLSKRAQELQETMRPPSMLAREQTAQQSKQQQRPNSVTKEDDFRRKSLGPEEVRVLLEKSQQKWDKRMANTKEVW